MSVDQTAAASTVPPANLDLETGHHNSDGMLKLAFGAIGIVFGDIGTSPLYAFRETSPATTSSRSIRRTSWASSA